MYRCNFKNRTVFFAFVFNHSSDHAGEQCSPLRGNIGYDQARHKRNGQDKFPTGCRQSFCTKSAQQLRTATPQPAPLTAPLTQGSQGGAVKSSGALPPLCKGRWVGVSRLGGVVFSVAHPHCTDTYIASTRPERAEETVTSAITVWVQLQCATKKCLPLEGKVSPQVTDEVFSNPFAAGKHNLLSALNPFCEAKPNKRA